jgi:hypothetical protein
MQFTFSERTVLKHTYGEAIRMAEAKLVGRCRLCTDAVPRDINRMDKLLTVEKLSQVVEKLVDDSLFYNLSNC